MRVVADFEREIAGLVGPSAVQRPDRHAVETPPKLEVGQRFARGDQLSAVDARRGRRRAAVNGDCDRRALELAHHGPDVKRTFSVQCGKRDRPGPDPCADGPPVAFDPHFARGRDAQHLDQRRRVAGCLGRSQDYHRRRAGRLSQAHGIHGMQRRHQNPRTAFEFEYEVEGDRTPLDQREAVDHIIGLPPAAIVDLLADALTDAGGNDGFKMEGPVAAVDVAGEVCGGNGATQSQSVETDVALSELD